MVKKTTTKKTAKKTTKSKPQTAKGLPVHCSHTKMAPTASLVPNPRNPNTHSEKQTAAKLLDEEMVPVDEQQYKTDADEWADLIADNTIAEMADIDGSIMGDLIVELDQLNFDLDMIGLSPDEIQGYVLGPMDTVEGEDDIPEVKKAITKPGDLWLLGEHRVLCGDSTKAEDVERLMDGEKADMVFTDPPYNVDYGGSKNPRHKIRTIQNDKQDDSEWQDFCSKVFTNIKQHNKGDIYIWGASSPNGMRMRLWLIDAGAHWSATIIWKKQQLILSPAKYQRLYEPCFYGWFEKSSFCADRKQVEVWEFDRPHISDLHPTMKPVRLCEYGVGNSSVPGNSVMDLFLGSGSTLIACEKTKRKCYGMEIDAHYCDVIVKRWEQFTGNKATLSK